MKKKKICWLTGDYFIDVDLPVVPVLQQYYEIEWYVLKSYKSNIELRTGYSCIVKETNYRAKDPRMIFFYLKIISAILKKKPNILYVDFVGLPFFYPVLLNCKGIKDVHIIHAAHNVIPYEGWPDKRLMKWYINFIFKHNHNFQIFSRFLFDYFNVTYKNKNVFYAPLSLKDYGNIQTNNYNIDKTKRNFLFFGNVKLNKKLDLLIAAFKSLPKEFQGKANLTIAGACDEPERYYSLINDCPAISCYFKRIDDVEVPELFLNNDFLVLPYENVAQSGPHMIAYNYNIPVIASDIDGFKERIIADENGFLFEVNNEDSLRNTIIKAISLSEKDYLIMKEKLKPFVEENYSQDVIIDKYITFFNSLQQ